MENKTKRKNDVTITEELEKYRSLMEKMYWIFLTIIFVYERLGTTPFISIIKSYFGAVLSDVPADLVELLFNNFFNLRYMILVPAVYTIVMDGKDWKRRLVLTGLLLLGGWYAIYWRKQNDTLVFEGLLLVVASYGKDFKKIAYRGIGVTLGVLLLTFVLCLAGVLPDYQDLMGDMVRHSFGTTHCMDLAAHGCFIILIYIFVKNGILRWYEYAGIIVLSVLNVFLIGGQNSLFCVILATIGCVMQEVCQKKRWKLPQGISKVWCGALLLAFCIFAAIYFGLNYTYTEDPKMFYHRIGSLSGLENSLRTSSSVTRVLPFSWFGRYFLQFGSGYGGLAEKMGFYTFLDCSYIRIYVMYGIVAFILFMLVFSAIQYRLLKKGMKYGMFLLAIVAFHSFLEHRLIDPAYNVFLLLAFSAVPTGGWSKEKLREENIYGETVQTS